MARKTKSGRRKQSGKGFMDVLKAINQVAKDNKLISRGLGLIPHPAAQGASWLASQAGYGRPGTKRKCRQCGLGRAKCHQKGCGFFDDLGSGLGSVFGGIGSGLGSALGGLGGGIGSIFRGAIHGGSATKRSAIV